MRQTMRWGLAGLLLAMAVAPAAAQGERWSYEDPGSFWVSATASLGDHGGQAFADLGIHYPHCMLSGFSGEDVSPVWQVPGPQSAWPVAVDSADRADVHASLTRQGGTLLLSCYDSAGPLWTRTVSTQVGGSSPVELHVTPDGSRIVVGAYEPSNGTTRATVFSPSSSTPLITRQLDFGSFRWFETDATGSLAFLGGMTVKVINLDTGALVHSQFLGFNPINGDLSADGKLLAYSFTGGFRVYRKVGANYALGLSYAHTPPTYPGTDVVFSADGSRLAAAFEASDSTTRVDLACFNLDTSLRTMAATVNGSSPAGYANRIVGLALSSTGRRMAAGFWGDETGVAPEVQIFDTDQNQPSATYDLPGSALAIDLSPDGKRLLVASEQNHVSASGTSRGRIDLFDLDARDFDLIGVPRAGATVEVRFRNAPAGPVARLLSATQPARRPIYQEQLGGIMYLLRRSTGLGGAAGTVSPGNATFSYTFPNAAGEELYFQGLTSALTSEWARVTILP